MSVKNSSNTFFFAQTHTEGYERETVTMHKMHSECSGGGDDGRDTRVYSNQRLVTSCRLPSSAHQASPRCFPQKISSVSWAPIKGPIQGQSSLKLEAHIWAHVAQKEKERKKHLTWNHRGSHLWTYVTIELLVYFQMHLVYGLCV